MKILITIKTLSVITGFLILVTACSERQTEKTADQVSDSTREAYQNTKDFVSDGWNSIKDYTYDRKDQFSDTMSAMGDSIEKRYRDIKGSNLSDDAKRSIENALSKFKRSMKNLGDATADTWDDAKDEAHEAWEELKDVYDDATN